jgi:hypothetical protein
MVAPVFDAADRKRSQPFASASVRTFAAAKTTITSNTSDIPGSPSTWPQSWQMSLIGPIKPLHLGHGISLLLCF